MGTWFIPSSGGGPRKRALVTGASSGLGAAFAKRLAGEGHDLILVARRREHLEILAKQLAVSQGVEAEALDADLADRDALRQVERRAGGDTRLEVLVNCAGIGTGAPFAEMEAERAEAEILLNVLALMRLTRAVLPGMIERECGTIINVASLAAFQPVPYFANYAATKAYVTSFTEALSAELRGTGVRLQALCPGPVATQFGEGAGVAAGRVPAWVVATPESVVNASLADLRRGREVCVPGALQRAAASIRRVLPRSVRQRLGRKLGKRLVAPAP